MYARTVAEIEKTFLGLTPAENDDIVDPTNPAYLLWMCNQVKIMDPSSIESALKASRWIGWMVSAMEIFHGWSSQDSRALIRSDTAELHEALQAPT